MLRAEINQNNPHTVNLSSSCPTMSTFKYVLPISAKHQPLTNQCICTRHWNCEQVYTTYIQASSAQSPSLYQEEDATQNAYNDQGPQPTMVRWTPRCFECPIRKSSKTDAYTHDIYTADEPPPRFNSAYLTPYNTSSEVLSSVHRIYRDRKSVV